MKKYTRIPKVSDLRTSGVPAEAIPTYCALADYANNKTGLCWPKMETLARTLGRSVRTVQRHIHLLKELGLIEFVERRRHRGRFSSYLYRVLFIATTGHERHMEKPPPIKKRTRPSTNPLRELCSSDSSSSREEAERRRVEGYEWLFK